MNKSSTDLIRKSILNSLSCNRLVLKLLGGNHSFEGRFNNVIISTLDRYEESHRYYHSIKHVKNLFDLIYKIDYSYDDKEFLQLAALFHDVVYCPKSKNNEEESAKLFIDVMKANSPRYDEFFQKTVDVVANIILETQYFKKEGSTPLSVEFNKLDLDALINGSFNELLENEKDIFKEYQFVSYPFYKKNRLVFLESIKTHPLVAGKNDKNLETLKAYVESYVPNIGVYVGSFNPFHVGHRDILKKSEKLFDKVIIVRGINDDKVLFDDDKCGRENYLAEVLPYHETTSWCSSTTNFMKEVAQYAKVTLIRGLRNGYDFSKEVNQLRFMEDMYKEELSVVFIPCDRKYDYISSSAIRSIQNVCKLDCKEYL